MKKSEVMAKVLDGISALLLDKGFRLRKKDQSIIRKINGVTQKIEIPMWDYWPLYYSFTLLVSVRDEVAAAIFNHFFDIPPEFCAETDSAIGNLKYFLDGEGREYKVTTMDEVSKAISDLTPIVLEKILPFFERCTSIHGIDAALNTDSHKFAITNPLSVADAAKALIAARLAANPKFANLANQYEVAIRGLNDDNQCRMNKLLAFLREYDIANPPSLPTKPRAAWMDEKWTVGHAVRHPEFGVGVIVKVGVKSRDVKVKFEQEKRLITLSLEYAPLEKI